MMNGQMTGLNSERAIRILISFPVSYFLDKFTCQSEPLADFGHFSSSHLEMLVPGGSLAKYMNDDDSDAEGQDQEGEEDLKDDPIYTMDLQVRLVFCHATRNHDF